MMEPVEWTTDAEGVSTTMVEDIRLTVFPGVMSWSWIIDTPMQRYAYGGRFRTEEDCKKWALIEVGHMLRKRGEAT